MAEALSKKAIWDSLTDDQKLFMINGLCNNLPETPDIPNLSWETVQSIFNL